MAKRWITRFTTRSTRSPRIRVLANPPQRQHRRDGKIPRMRRFVAIASVVFAACGLALLLRAADAPPASRVSVPALAEMEETSAPGLKLTIEQGAIKDVRDARLV